VNKDETMNKLSKISFMFLFIFSTNVYAEENCPPNVDKIYCQLAAQTGGKVYSGDVGLNPKILLEDKAKTIEPVKHTHKYSAYSKNLGCSEMADKRGHEICQSISNNLEWGWAGHATIAPSWRVNWSSVKNVFCELKMSGADLPALAKICGGEIKPHMVCLNPSDPRLASGVEYLINTIQAQDKSSDEFKGTVYDPQNDRYLLKGGCAE